MFDTSNRRRAGYIAVWLVASILGALLISCGSADEPGATEEPGVAVAPAAPAPGPAAAPAPEMTTYAGSGSPRFKGDGGPATDAGMFAPISLAVDGEGNLYIGADRRIRKVDAATGIITTVAGTGSSFPQGDDGPALKAGFKDIRGLAVDGPGNIFIADNTAGLVRRVDAATGIITSVAGGGLGAIEKGGVPTIGEEKEVGDGLRATEALLNLPDDLAVDKAGNLYIAALNRIRKVDAVTGIIDTIAGIGERGLEGDGLPATEAGLAEPVGVALDGAGNIFIADRDNHRIRRVDAVTGIITTVAGIGRHTKRTSYAYQRQGDLDTARFVNAAMGVGYSGDGGPATEAMMSMPVSVAVDPLGNLYIAEGRIRIRRVDADTGVITTLAAGEFEGSYETGKVLIRTTIFGELVSVAVDGVGGVFLADFKNNVVHRVSTQSSAAQ